MRVQTYASWEHRHVTSPHTGAATQSADGLASVIATLIAQVTYYPSFAIQIVPAAQGLLLQGSQPIVQAEEQPDGMVSLRTHGRQVWITRADYHRLVLA